MSESPSRRLTATDYFDEAIRVLEELGFPALTAAGLCSRLGATRGSFYHHFWSFDDFVEKFLVYWEQQYSRDLIAESDSPELWSQIRKQAELAIGLPHAAEAALRAWGTIDPRVAAAQHEVDELRRRGLADSLQRHGISKRRAEVCATVAIATLAGMQVTQRAIDRDALRSMYDELEAIFGDHAADGQDH